MKEENGNLFFIIISVQRLILGQEKIYILQYFPRLPVVSPLARLSDPSVIRGPVCWRRYFLQTLRAKID